MSEKDFKVTYEKIGKHLVKVRKPLKTISTEEFQRKTYQILKEAWEKQKKQTE